MGTNAASRKIRQLPHQDRDALCMKTYGDLPDDHSRSGALNVRFYQTGAVRNLPPLP